MKFYTYLWLRQNGTPYYVGKGSGDRAFRGMRNKVVPPPPNDRIIVQFFESEKVAFEAEIFLIAFYGRKNVGTGCLINLTEGGDKPPKIDQRGWKRSEEFKQKCRLSHLGKKQSPEFVEKRVAALRGRKRPASLFTPEWKQKQSLAHIGKCFMSKETLLKQSNLKKGKPWPAARRAAYERSLEARRAIA